MPDAPVSTEPVPADSQSPSIDASDRSDKGNGDNGARAIALLAGVLVGTFVGMGIGIRIGNAARKRMDRWSPCY